MYGDQFGEFLLLLGTLWINPMVAGFKKLLCGHLH